MRILLTNDDGFFAPGLQSLNEVLQTTEHEVFIVAPENQRSAAGHSITLFEPLLVNEHKLQSNKGYSVRGTPSDCVKLAIQGELIPAPDVIISGINSGQNLGTDVFYSGTVAAAMEGVLLGIPAVAVSLADYEYKDFKPAAQFIAANFSRFLAQTWHGLININIPGIPQAQWKGIRFTKLGKSVYKDVFAKYVDPHGKSFYWQGGTLNPDEELNTDLRAIREGFISITPLHSDLTDYAQLEKLQRIF